MIKQKIENIPYWVYDGLSVLSSVITILTCAYCCVKAVIQIHEVDGEYNISFNRFLLLIIVLLGMLLIVIIIKLKKYYVLLQKEKKTVSFNFYNAAHDLRNTYFETLKKHKNNKNVDREYQIEYLTTDTQKFLVNLLDYLCEILKNLTGREIHGSIKLIENPGSGKKIDIQEATVKTFCRSKNTQKERISNDKFNKKSVRIMDNSDFCDILLDADTNSYFYQSNLLEFAKQRKKVGKPYNNSTKNWSDYYKSTIVAPIRIANERLFFNELDEGYNVIGFLCVDSLAVDAFRDTQEDRENLSYIVKSFAAETYIILNMYGYYLKQLKG